MRYLDKYKMFESSSPKNGLVEMCLGAEDILREVSDINYYGTSIAVFDQHYIGKVYEFPFESVPDNVDIFGIIIQKRRLKFEDIKDCVARLLEYLKEEELINNDSIVLSVRNDYDKPLDSFNISELGDIDSLFEKMENLQPKNNWEAKVYAVLIECDLL